MPKHIGRYVIGPSIGKGTYAQVRVAHDSQSSAGKSYAVKVIDRKLVLHGPASKSPSAITSPTTGTESNAAGPGTSSAGFRPQWSDAERVFRTRIMLLKELSHTHVVRLFDTLQTDSHVYLIFEMISGGDLQKHVEAGGRLDEGTARRRFQEIVLGLRYCHEKEVGHGDLRPEKILLDAETGAAKISDMGVIGLLSERATKQQQGPQQKGDNTTTKGPSATANDPSSPTSNTEDSWSQLLAQQRKDREQSRKQQLMLHQMPQYLPPEFFSEPKTDPIKADIWALGILLFFMMSGSIPFDHANGDMLRLKIEAGDFRMPKYFTDPLMDLIARLLTIEPSRRIGLREVLCHPWVRVDMDATAAAATRRVAIQQPSSTSAAGGGGAATGTSTKGISADASVMGAAPPAGTGGGGKRSAALSRATILAGSAKIDEYAAGGSILQQRSQPPQQQQGGHATLSGTQAATTRQEQPADGFGVITLLLQQRFGELVTTRIDETHRDHNNRHEARAPVSSPRRTRIPVRTAAFALPLTFDMATQRLMVALTSMRTSPVLRRPLLPDATKANSNSALLSGNNKGFAYAPSYAPSSGGVLDKDDSATMKVLISGECTSFWIVMSFSGVVMPTLSHRLTLFCVRRSDGDTRSFSDFCENLSRLIGVSEVKETLTLDRF